MIDVSKEAAADEKFLMEPTHIEAWESLHGRIPDGAWVLMRTDWSKRTDPALFLNMKEDGPHVPGPSAATFISWSSSAMSPAGASKRSAPTPARASPSNRLFPPII